MVELRRPPPKLGSAAVVSKDESLPIANIDGKWQLLELPRRHFENLFLII